MYNNIPQDTTTIDISVEEAVVSDTVKVSVDIVLSTKAEDATNVRGSILDALNGLLVVEWAFTKLDRSTDRSGMEVVEATASARVKEATIAGLAAKAKEVSREGFQLTVGALDYNPARNVVDNVMAELRKKIYTKAQVEADVLNELAGKDANGRWRVGAVQFYDTTQPRSKSAGVRMAAVSYALEAADSSDDTGLDLTQKVGLNAHVTLHRLVI